MNYCKNICCLLIEKGPRILVRLFFESNLGNVWLAFSELGGGESLRGFLIFKQMINVLNNPIGINNFFTN
jgi:hypothetical protein